MKLPTYAPVFKAPALGQATEARAGGQAWCSQVLAGLWPSQMPLTFTAFFLLLGWPVRSGVRSKCGWGLDAFHQYSSGHSLPLVPANTKCFSRWLFMICQERPQPKKASSQHIRRETRHSGTTSSCTTGHRDTTHLVNAHTTSSCTTGHRDTTHLVNAHTRVLSLCPAFTL